MKCEKCKKEHNGTYGSGRFCCRSCANARKHTKEIKQKISKSLQGNCYNKGFKHSEQSKLSMSESRKKYWKQKIENKIKITIFHELPKRYRDKILFEEKGNRCEQCGLNYIDKKTKKGPYEIHHKDGNKNNNKKENLQILCLNCHWKTENWRFRNQKHSSNTKLKIGTKSKNRKNKSWLN